MTLPSMRNWSPKEMRWPTCAGSPLTVMRPSCDQLLHVAARTDARLCQHLLQFGRIGLGRQHALDRALWLGFVALGLGRLGVEIARQQVREDFADFRLRQVHTHFGASHIGTVVATGVTSDAWLPTRTIHGQIARRVATAPTAPAVATAAWAIAGHAVRRGGRGAGMRTGFIRIPTFV